MTNESPRRLARGCALFTLFAMAVSLKAPVANADNELDPLAHSPLRETEEARERLLKRPDEDRPDEQFTLPLFGRPLTIGGQWELQTRFEADTRLGLPPPDDVLGVGQRLEIEVSYKPFDDVSVYLETKLFYVAVPYRERGGHADDFFVERGETWIYLADIFDSPFSLQIGRQRFNETREWWWDEDLDAARLHFDQGDFHAEFSVAQEVAKLGSLLDHIDPRSKDVFRILSQATWQWSKKNYVEAFVHYQHDHSETEPELTIVEPLREDPDDANLTWFGVGANGRIKNKSSSWHYWAQLAFVVGHENYIDYDTDPPSGLRFVDSIDRHRVSGMGVDLGLTLATELPGSPSFTLGYAYASGKQASDRDGDRSFRQTRLNDNNGRFRGVDRFRYYGELFDPNLSNMHLATVALGFRMLRSSSIEFLYHAYDQVETVPFLHDTGIRREPTGQKSFIGQELDIVVGIEEWENVQIELIGGIFRAGSAFGPAKGDFAYLGSLEIQFNF